MSWLLRTTLKKLRKVHTALAPAAHEKSFPKIDYRGQEASDQIKRLLARNEPCLICRLGLSELRVLVNYLDVANPAPFWEKCRDYITEKRDRFWWDEKNRIDVCEQSGFFPNTDEMIGRFSTMMVEDAKSVDLLGSWRKLESRLEDYYPAKMIRVPLDDLSPFEHADPWSEVLTGRRVLVIHPFEQSILTQYAKRKLLFKDPRVLPDFELKTIKAVQTLFGVETKFPNWFEALDSMRRKMDQIDYDVAIVGAGAYGLPLAAHAKRQGKQGVHLGGVSQMLFGIRGKRWDDQPHWQRLFNEHWIRPGEEERPTTYKHFEGGSYW